MKILVTGSKGQLARSLVERAPRFRDVELVTIGRPGLDLTDRDRTISTILAKRPDIVISTAAYTAVDQAEDEPELAYAVNAAGAAHAAEATALAGVPIIHISTDYVFAGTSPEPYTEDCSTVPSSIYGLTKLEGERAVARINPRHAIVRTSWVYSPFGHNFVRSMLRMARDRREIRIVADQWGNPTSALDLADALLTVATKLGQGRFGVYHLTGQGETNWSGFARHIFWCSRAAGGPSADVVDIPAADYLVRARRPANSRLCGNKVDAEFGLMRPDWHGSTDIVVRRLLSEAANG